MQRFKDSTTLFAIGILLFLFTIGLYNALTHNAVYENSLSYITHTYHKDSTAILFEDIGYEKNTNKGLLG